jgi:subtilisin family serine protease
MHVPPPPVHPANPARRPHPPIPAVARRFGALALSLLILLAACQLAIPARAAAAPGPKGAEAVPNQLIVSFRADATEAARDAAVQRRGGRTLKKLVGVDARLVELPAGRVAAAEAGAYAAEQGVRYVEPNLVYTIDALPNDPSFPNLWGLRNPGVPGADIGAPAAWDVTKGSGDIVVGIVDTGIDYSHPDLAANVWTAPAGWSLNGCGAGTHGYRVVAGAAGCDPLDDNNHGSHVAGTIGAAGNNGAGVTGVNWNVGLMALKFLDSSGRGYLADAVAVIDYAIQAKRAGVNLRVLNNSWGATTSSQALADKVAEANAAGILFVAAAGNNAWDNDSNGFYPANYTLPNVVAVAAADSQDQLAGFSNYGAASVHLGAPGVNIYSTVRGGYSYYNGTSMATPHVSGAAALVLSAPGLGGLDVAGLKDRLLSCGTALPALAGKTTTGKRLNVGRSVAGCSGGSAPTGPAPSAPSTPSTPPASGPAYALTASASGNGSVAVAPGVSAYAPGATVALSATPNAGALFTGWTVDGAPRGWANPLTLTMDSSHAVVATFAAAPTFRDVPAGDPAAEAIAELAARGIIKGYADGRFGPGDPLLRAQMAALIARAVGWDAEDHGNKFPDRGAVDTDLWRNVGTLAFYEVARGYPDGTFGPGKQVLRAQTISFITRAMVAQGYWQPQPDDPALYPNVPASSGHRADLATYVFYAGAVPGTEPTADWDGWGQPATRAWFALAQWQALQSYLGGRS